MDGRGWREIGSLVRRCGGKDLRKPAVRRRRRPDWKNWETFLYDVVGSVKENLDCTSCEGPFFSSLDGIFFLSFFLTKACSMNLAVESGSTNQSVPGFSVPDPGFSNSQIVLVTD